MQGQTKKQMNFPDICVHIEMCMKLFRWILLYIRRLTCFCQCAFSAYATSYHCLEWCDANHVSMKVKRW